MMAIPIASTFNLVPDHSSDGETSFSSNDGETGKIVKGIWEHFISEKYKGQNLMKIILIGHGCIKHDDNCVLGDYRASNIQSVTLYPPWGSKLNSTAAKDIIYDQYVSPKDMTLKRDAFFSSTPPPLPRHDSIPPGWAEAEDFNTIRYQEDGIDNLLKVPFVIMSPLEANKNFYLPRDYLEAAERMVKCLDSYWINFPTTLKDAKTKEEVEHILKREKFNCKINIEVALQQIQYFISDTFDPSLKGDLITLEKMLRGAVPNPQFLQVTHWITHKLFNFERSKQIANALCDILSTLSDDIKIFNQVIPSIQELKKFCAKLEKNLFADIVQEVCNEFANHNDDVGAAANRIGTLGDTVVIPWFNTNHIDGFNYHVPLPQIIRLLSMIAEGASPPLNFEIKVITCLSAQEGEYNSKDDPIQTDQYYRTRPRDMLTMSGTNDLTMDLMDLKYLLTFYIDDYVEHIISRPTPMEIN